MGELVAPFPYFGGKSRAADQVWEALGEVENYVEARCSGQSQSFGCRPVRFVALFGLPRARGDRPFPAAAHRSSGPVAPRERG